MSEQTLSGASAGSGSGRRNFVQALTAGGAAFALAAASEQTAAAQAAPPRPLGTVRISLPVSVAFSLTSLQSTIQTILGQIGCKTCFSGADCQFVQEREFLVETSAAGAVTVVVGETSTAPTPQNTTVVGFGGAESASLSAVLQAVANVAGVLGCAACHSGFDVSWVNEVILLGVTQSLAVQKFGAVAP